MATGDKNDMLARLKAALPSRWFGSNPAIVGAVLSGFASSLAWLYSLYLYIQQQTRIATATGAWLDLAASDFFGTGLPRLTNELDPQYRARIRAALFVERGTRNAIYYTLMRLTGRAPIIFEPARPADTGALISSTLTPININIPVNGYIATAQAAANKSLTMDTSANNSADYYVNAVLSILNGTGAGQQRNVVTSRQNLLKYSQSMLNAAYEVTQLHGTIAACATPDSDGSYNAFTYTEDATVTGRFLASPSCAVVAGTQYVVAIDFQMGTGATRYGGLVFPSAYFGANVIAAFTLSGAGAAMWNGLGTNAGAGIVSLGNGWYRCWITAQCTVSGNAQSQLRISNSSTNGAQSYQGDGVSNINMGRLQLEVGSIPSEYVHTEANPAVGVAVDTPWSSNMLRQSSAFNTSPWVTNNCSVTPNAALAPDGTMSMDLLTTTTATDPWVNQSPSIVPNGSYTYSCHVKQGSAARALLRCPFSGGMTKELEAWFDFATGTWAGVNDSHVTPLQPVNVGNGVWRIGAVFTDSGSNTTANTRVVGATSVNGYLAGDSIYTWGAQLEYGASMSPYISTTASPAVLPGATSLFELSPIYQLSQVAVPMGLALNTAGGLGSLQMPYQALVTAYYPLSAGIPLVAGLGVSVGGLNTPSRSCLADQSSQQLNQSLTAIFQAVDSVKPIGTIVWVAPSN